MSIIEKVEQLEKRNPEWFAELMNENRVTVAHISDYTGLNYQAVHQYVSGRKNMPKTMKAILWMYLKFEIKAGI